MILNMPNFGLFVLLGVISGTASTVAFVMIPEDFRIVIGNSVVLSTPSIAPGLIFGIIFGSLLKYRGLAETKTAALYALASTASYFVAVHMMIQNYLRLEEPWQFAMILGATASTCLTAAAAALLPFTRRLVPIALMVLSGCSPGAMAELTVGLGAGIWGIMFFAVVGQTIYAAAFATALPSFAVER
jgi:hypothetical protein